MRLPLAALLACPLAAQAFEPISEGPFSGLAHGLSVGPLTSGPSGPLDPKLFLAKQPGFQLAAPPTWAPAPNVPDFSTDAIFAGLAVKPEVAAMSIGLDWVVGDNTGRAVILPGQWGALTLSVTRATVGRAPASGQKWGRIWEEAQPSTPDGAGADLFSYILPGSETAGIPADWVDRTMRAQDSTEIRIFAPGVKGELDAHDLFVSFYTLDPLLVGLLPPEPWFYFTLTPATVDLVPAAWWGAAANRSPATILRCKWNATTKAWTSHQMFRTAADLGVTEPGGLVDALAVDETNQRILFSTQPHPSRDQIMFLHYGSDSAAAVTYRTGTTPEEPVSARIGLLPTGDDVDAICILDPGGSRGARFVVDKPQPSQLRGLLPTRISACAGRMFQNNQLLCYSALVGWPPSGRPPPTQPQPGFGALVLTPPGQLQPQIPLPWVQRNPQSPHQGGPVFLRLVVPNQRAFYGIELDFHWAALDVQRNSYDLSHPARLGL
jgi:hypothetical protein